MSEELQSKCQQEPCEAVRTGPITLAQNPNYPEADRKAPMKCEKCDKEWYEYF
jgi:hypothetical protein